MKNVVIHIPHDGHEIPQELEKSIIISKEEFKYYDQIMSDIYLNYIMRYLPYPKISFPYSRLICDVERFLKNESMEQYGMGFCYSRTFDGKIFKNINEEVLNITKKYYQKHHDILNTFAKKIIEPTLLIDLHSFNIKATRPEILNNKKEIPDICIGYESQYCSEKLRDLLKIIAEDFGYLVQINYPYCGTIIPQAVLNGLNIPLQSIMIEINRNCYIDKDGGLISREHHRLQNLLKRFIIEYSNFLNNV